MELGLIGLGKMGGNMAVRLVHGKHRVVGYARHPEPVQAIVKEGAEGASSLSELVGKLKPPRIVWLMIPSGAPVDQTLAELHPLLARGDYVVDGGNSYYRDTLRRAALVNSWGMHYVDVGTSGGIWGLTEGYSMMVGGEVPDVEHIRPILETLAPGPDKGWGRMGPVGSGHFVKMVHNGIEYGDIQLICEAYDLLHRWLGLNDDELHTVFTQWNQGELDSYLIEISSHIFAKKDDDGQPLVDKILDTAGQKGTGKWTVISALDLGQPVTLIGESVFARCLSALKDERVEASKILRGPKLKPPAGDRAAHIENVRRALYSSKIVSYTQGYMELRAAAKEYGWNLNMGGIALMWRGGCIIRSQFLGKIKAAFDKNPGLENLLLDSFFYRAVNKYQASLRRAVAQAIKAGIPTPAFSTALAFFDGYRSARLPANLLQAQRDYFGAHTYERVDQPRGQFFHTNWTGHGGRVSSSTYNA